MTIDSGFPVPPALVEHARRFRASGAVPAVPRVAATVLLLRPADEGFEVYLIRRVVAMAFGGMYAFPGGGVDPSDSTTHLDWAGPPPADWGVRLGLAPAAAQAVVCAAAREVFIPLQPHFLALQGLGKLLQTVSLVRGGLNSQLRVSGILFTMFETGTRLAQPRESGQPGLAGFPVQRELERADKTTALITMCCGSSVGTGTIIERI